MAHSIKSPTNGFCEHGNKISSFVETENFLPLERLSTSEGRTYIIN